MIEDPTLFALWVFATWVLARVFIAFLNNLSEQNAQLDRQIKNKLDDMVHRVEEVVEKDIIYWYDYDDSEFLAQGRTQEEIIDVLKSRFPTHVFYLKTHELIGSPSWEPRRLP